MDKDFSRKIASIAVLAGLIILSFLLLQPILMSIIAAILLAFIFTPIYKKINKKIKNKNLAAGLVCALLIILIILPLWFLTPVLLNQSIEIFIQSQKIDLVTPLKNVFPSMFTHEEFSKEIASVVYSFVTKITNGIVSTITKFILNFPTLFLHLLVMLFTFFFLLRDNEKSISYIQSILPFPKEVEDKLFRSSKDITFSVLYGQVVFGILQGIFVGISFFMFGVNNALFLTMIACLAGILPIIGTSIVWVPVLIILFIHGNIWPAIGVLSFGIIGSIFENAIKPVIISKRTNVHSSVILIGMVGGIYFFGLLGFIIGPLILSYLLIVLEIYRDKKTPGIFIEHPKDENEELDIKMGFF